MTHRALERLLLLIFSNFQRILRLEHLAVERDKFIEFEQRMHKAIWIMLSTAVSPLAILTCGYYFQSDHYYVSRSTSYLIVALYFITIWFYHCMTVSLLITLYRYHRLEFKSHAKKLILLYCTTEFTMLVIVAGQI